MVSLENKSLLFATLLFFITVIVVYNLVLLFSDGKVNGERIAYITPSDSTNVIVKWAIWLNKAIAVPLCAIHPVSDKQYFIDDSQAKLVIGKYIHLLQKLKSQTNYF